MSFNQAAFDAYMDIDWANHQWRNQSIQIKENLVDVLSGDAANLETSQAASYRWANSQRLETDEAFVAQQLQDFLQRYGLKTEENFTSFLKGKEVFLEIGAGEGRLVDWVLKYGDCKVIACEISDSVHYLSEKYKDEPRVLVLKGDAIDLPICKDSIDILACEQAIHHTDYPGQIFSNLCQYLRPSGKVLLSVYAQKSEQRERFDRLIRDTIAQLPAERKLEIAGGMTEIGRLLHEMDVTIDVPADQGAFGLIAGQTISLQRLIYYGVMKCFWNPSFSFEKCQEFNHDWYSYPKHHTVSFQEAAEWYKDNGLSIEHFDVNPSNINLFGTKQ